MNAAMSILGRLRALFRPSRETDVLVLRYVGNRTASIDGAAVADDMPHCPPIGRRILLDGLPFVVDLLREPEFERARELVATVQPAMMPGDTIVVSKVQR